MTTPFNVLNIKLLCPLFCEVIIDHDRSQFRLMVSYGQQKLVHLKSMQLIIYINVSSNWFMKGNVALTQ